MARFLRAMMMGVDRAAKAMKDAEIEDFIGSFNHPTWRGVRINGEQVPVWSSQHGSSG